MSRVEYFYFVIDVSNSMRGRRIGAVNDAVYNIVHRLKRFVVNESLEAKIIAMTYADSPKWSDFLPVDISKFAHLDLYSDGQQSNLGKALNELNEKMQRQGEIDEEKGASTTVIFFTDGLSTDEIQEPVEALHANPVYENATRIGVTFKDSVSKDIAEELLEQLVNSHENIVFDDFVGLNRMIFEKYK